MFAAAGRAGLHGQHSEASQHADTANEQARDVLLGRIFPRRAQVIDTATLRGLLPP